MMLLHYQEAEVLVGEDKVCAIEYNAANDTIGLLTYTAPVVQPGPECSATNGEVGGSNPSGSSTLCSGLAQLVVRSPVKREDVGPNPTSGAKD